MNDAAEPQATASDVTPEELVNDFLIGAYEMEKLRNGFVAPVGEGEPCEEHRALDSGTDSR
jgi:hypothetical protein